ncbi:MAG: YfhO family protein, partial [Clostridia bacterium]|nr:YfhO family protein [Clostridia bacterium]
TFLVAFVDKADMLSFANVLVMLKMCAIAGTSSYYLYTRNPNAPVLNVALSVMNAVSGYVMMYYQNVIWLDMVCVFPLLMLGLDRLKEGKRLMFTVVLAACLFINYYLSFMIVVFLLLYAAVWVILSKNMRFAGDFIICCAVAALLSAVVWLPSFAQYFASGRKSSVIETLKSSSVLTAYDTTVPTLLSVLFLYPFALFGARRMTDRSNHLAVLLLLTTVPVILEPVNKMWQTGNYMSFPTRYAFITVFLCVTAAFEGLSCKGGETADNACFKGDALGKGIKSYLSIILSAATVSASVVYCFFAVRYTKNNIEVMDAYASSLWGDEQSLRALFTVYSVSAVIGASACVLHRLRMLKPMLACLAVCVIVAAEFFISPQVYMVAPAHEVEYFKDIVDLSGRIESEEFYRVKTDKDYTWRDFAVNMLGGIGYNALGHYTSLTPDNYMTAIKQMGYTSYWMEVGNSGGTEITDAVMSVGYEISSRSGDAVYENEYYKMIKKDYFLPLGLISAEDVIASTESGVNKYTDRASHQKTLARELLGDEDIVNAYGIDKATLYNVTVEHENGKIILSPTGTGARVRFNINQGGSYALYFNVFCENNNSLRQPVNGKLKVSSPKSSAYSFPSQKDNGVLKMGSFEGNSYVSVSIQSRVEVTEFSVFTVDLGKLSESVNKVKAVGLNERRNGLAGEITAVGGECVFLSVPYDSGMRLKINGRRGELYEVYGGFTAFYLEAGENRIEISYVSPGFATGAVIAAFGLMLVLAAAVAKKRQCEIALPPRVQTVCGYAVALAGVAVFAVVYVAPMILCII